MATYNNNCVGCGCGPAIPEPCITPPPVCPNPQPCTEIVNAECVVYTGPGITCKDNPIIPQNSSLAEALDAIVDYICLGACCALPAVNEIDNPDYLLLCVDSKDFCAYTGKLYNWYALNAGTAGDGRVSGGIVNINPLDNQINTWRVPNDNDWYALALALDPLATQSPWANNAGGKCKSTTCWSLPNAGATNSSGLGIVPGVVRYSSPATFSPNNGQSATYWGGSSTYMAYTFDYMSDDITQLSVGLGGKTAGLRVRLVRPIDCNETNGDFIANAYKDNAGNLYNAEVIGNLVWLVSDLIDTKYNNGTTIPNVVFNAAWEAATTGAWCYPENNASFLINYVNGCEQVKIAFADFLDYIPTSTQAFVVNAGAGIQVNPVTVGSQTTFTVVNTDPGSSQNIFKNIAVASQSTVVADSNNDTLTLIAGTGIGITTNSVTDEITITNTAPDQAVTLADAGTTTHESLVNDGVGPALAVKGLKFGTGLVASSTATDITISLSGAVLKYVSGTLTGTPIVTHNLGTTSVFVSILNTATNVQYVQGVNYNVTITSAASITITNISMSSPFIVTVIG